MGVQKLRTHRSRHQCPRQMPCLQSSSELLRSSRRELLGLAFLSKHIAQRAQKTRIAQTAMRVFLHQVSFRKILRYSSYANTRFLEALVVSLNIPSSTNLFTAEDTVL